MKILCLSRAPLDYFGGIPAFCLNLYSNNCFDVTSYSYDINNNISKEYIRQYKGIKEHVFPSEFKFRTIAISLNYLYSILKNNSKFSHVHVQHPDPFSAFSVLLMKLFNPKIKIVITWHAEVYKNYVFFAPFLFILDILLFSISEKIVFFTPAHIKDSFLAKIPFVKSRIIQISNCIKLPFIDIRERPLKHNYNLSTKNVINFLSIGRLVSYKGYEYSIKALANLDSSFIYTIIGDGPLKSKLNLLINDLGMDRRIRLVGTITNEEKYKLLNSSDIFLFPSINTSEAYGLVQMEAMHYEIPIINTFLSNGVNFLAPPDIALTCKPKSYKALNKRGSPE